MAAANFPDPRAFAEALVKKIRAHVWIETVPLRDRIEKLEAELAALRQAARLQADATEKMAR